MNINKIIPYGDESAKVFSAKYFQRIQNSEKDLSERIFKLRARIQSVGEGEMYFRAFCVSRICFRGKSRSLKLFSLSRDHIHCISSFVTLTLPIV
jgi:ribosomal protein S14